MAGVHLLVRAANIIFTTFVNVCIIRSNNSSGILVRIDNLGDCLDISSSVFECVVKTLGTVWTGDQISLIC